MASELSKNVSNRRKAENKRKKKKKWQHLRVVQLNDWDVFRVSLFTGEGRKMDKGGAWEIKVWGAPEQGTGSRRC